MQGLLSLLKKESGLLCRGFCPYSWFFLVFFTGKAHRKLCVQSYKALRPGQVQPWFIVYVLYGTSALFIFVINFVCFSTVKPLESILGYFCFIFIKISFVLFPPRYRKRFSHRRLPPALLVGGVDFIWTREIIYIGNLWKQIHWDTINGLMLCNIYDLLF